MKEYIERETVLAMSFCTAPATMINPYGGESVVRVDDIEKIPAADVVERKRGRWLEIDGEVFECDMCHRIHTSYKYDFCPECGSDMREVDHAD